MLPKLQFAGLADPGPVVTALWTDKELEAGVTLDAVVTVVDASRVARQLSAPPAATAANEAEQQIAHADLVLLNKVRIPGSRHAPACLSQASHLGAPAFVLASVSCQLLRS